MSQPPAISLLLKTASDLAYSNSREDQIRYLRLVYNEPLRYILQGAYHPNVIWTLPEGDLSFVPTERSHDADSKLYREYKKLYIFCKGGADSLSQEKKNSLFIQLLESVHPDDAEMLICMKDKSLPYSGLDYELISEAFPGMLPPKKVEAETVLDKPEVKAAFDFDNMTDDEKDRLEALFKAKYEKVTPPEKVAKTHTNKGKTWWNDGEKSFLATESEASEKGYVSGRLALKKYKS